MGSTGKLFARFVRFLTGCAFALLIAIAITFTAKAQTVYNSIPSPLPGNVASEGPEAYAFSALGDGFTLAGAPGGTLGVITVILSSWGCQTGAWYTNNCVTSPGATFSQPITINVYSVSGGPGTWAPLAQLGTLTQTFNIPYRPSADPVNCTGGNAGKWYDPVDGCHNGIASPISIDFTSLGVVLPQRIIVTVVYNTSHYGPNPIGTAAPCYSSSGGCPYDSLNISTDTTTGTYVFIGSALDPNGIFVNYTFPANSCTGAAPTGVLALDTGCWAGFHPEIQVNLAGSRPTLDAVYQVRYAANYSSGGTDNVIVIINDGGNGSVSQYGPSFGTANSGDICVNVYVFDPAEELLACCSCPITPNQVVNLSVNTLMSNLLTPEKPSSLTIKLLGSAGAGPFTDGSCKNEAASVLTATVPPAAHTVVGGFVAFGTAHHIAGSTNAVTETRFLPATLSPSELTSLTSRCSSILGNGSGAGACSGCTAGALGAAKM